jgi:hypothetical protein
MQTLRHTKHLARLALAWFVLSLGAAAATPLLHTQNYIMVCSSNGMYQLLLDGDERNDQGSTSRTTPTLKCPLCIALDAPPDLLGSTPLPMALPAMLASPTTAATRRKASLCAAPLPARGPPNHALRA